MSLTVAPANTTHRSASTAPRHRVAIILAVALATRLLALGNPVLYTDEEFYFAAARAMTHGALPFVDIWDRKPVGLFLLYWPAAALPGGWGIWAYQVAALACAAATALIVARLADAAGWARGAIPAALAYLGWLTIAGGQGGQSPVFYNTAMALAALLIARRDAATSARDAAAMLLVGLAIQVKYTAALEGLYFGLWLIAADRRVGRSPTATLGRAVLLAGIALLPTAAAIAAYARLDALPAFIFANFASIFARHGDPAAVQLGSLAIALAILAPLLALAARSPAPHPDRIPGARAFLLGWLGAALLAFALVPPWPDHYTLPVLLPAAAMAAGGLALLRESARGRTIAAAIVLAAILVGQVTLIVDRQRRGTPAQFAALVTAIDTAGAGTPGCLYVYSGSSMLYPATGRCAVSRYVFPSHLTRTRETGAIGVDQAAELRRIFARAPALVVMGPRYAGERADIRAAASALIARDYRPVAQAPLGRKRFTVYRRRTPAGTAGPVLRFD